jgi:hypothetical protein
MKVANLTEHVVNFYDKEKNEQQPKLQAGRKGIHKSQIYTVKQNAAV